MVQMEPQNDDIGMSSDESETTESLRNQIQKTSKKQVSDSSDCKQTDEDRFKEYEELLMNREDLFDRFMKRKCAQIDEFLSKHRRKDENESKDSRERPVNVSGKSETDMNHSHNNSYSLRLKITGELQ